MVTLVPHHSEESQPPGPFGLILIQRDVADLESRVVYEWSARMIERFPWFFNAHIVLVVRPLGELMGL